MTARYTTADLEALARDKGPFFADNARQALLWAARTLEAADAAVNAERLRAEALAQPPQAAVGALITDEMIDAGAREIAFQTQGFGGARTLAHYSSPAIEIENVAKARAALEGALAARPPAEPEMHQRDVAGDVGVTPGVWQPIETAPMDGAWVLLAGGVIDGGDEAGINRMVVGQRRYHEIRGDYDGWAFAKYDGGFYGIYEDPTHWAPLPPPPGAATQSRPHESESERATDAGEG